MKDSIVKTDNSAYKMRIERAVELIKSCGYVENPIKPGTYIKPGYLDK